jgi:hypothetical protein
VRSGSPSARREQCGRLAQKRGVAASRVHKPLLGAALVLLIAAGALGRRVAESKPASAAAAPDQPEALPARPRTAPPTYPRRSERGVPLAQPQQDGSIIALPAASPAVAAHPEQGTDAGADDVLERWSLEAVDADASDALGEQVEDALRDLEIAGELLDLSCRKTLCRVSMRFQDLKAAQAFSDQASSPERRQRLEISLDEEERYLVTVFASR